MLQNWKSLCFSIPRRNARIKKHLFALARWLSWVNRHPVHQNVAGSIPVQGTCLGWGFDPQLGHMWEASDWCFSLTSVSLSLSLSLLPSLKINKHILRWGLKKKKKKEISFWLERKKLDVCYCVSHIAPGGNSKKNMLVELISGETDIVALAHGIGREEALEM